MDDPITQARADLATLDGRLPELFEHLYAPDGPMPDRARSEQRKRSFSPELWVQPGQVQACVHDVADELSRAHWLLARNTDVPAHCLRKPVGEWQSASGKPKWQRPTPKLEDTRLSVWLLSGELAWCADENLSGHAAVVEACGHVTAALGLVEDLWPSRSQRSCGHCGRAHNGSESWCRRCEQAHMEGGSCRVCAQAAA